MKILLISNVFNGLTQRIWLDLRAAGHQVTVELAVSERVMVEAVALADPDLVICPFLLDRLPAEIWAYRRTIIIHPGPKGDRGPSSLDWAITGEQETWGVTALQAMDELDAGPIWASRQFPVSRKPVRKSTLYNGEVADAAVELVREVVAKAADLWFEAEPLDYGRPDVWGQLRPPMRQADRAFDWGNGVDHVVRRIRAADGVPGVRTELCGVPVYAFDAHPGDPTMGDPGIGEPGTVLARQHGAVLVHTGHGAVWIGHLKRVVQDSDADCQSAGIKLPATTVLAHRLAGVPELISPMAAWSHQRTYREISYCRGRDVGELTFNFYNGAMSTSQCRRLVAALRYATAQDTRALLIRGGEVFSNGINLNVIEAAPHPAAEAWANIIAMNEVCAEILNCTRQVVVTAMAGNAGAGGVMMALGADHVLLRDGAVLNPHYRSMGLYGSEYWTYVLPRRVGQADAIRLTDQCLPVSASEALGLGLVDAVLPRDPAAFDAAVRDHVDRLLGGRIDLQWLGTKRERREADESRKPLEAYRVEELAEMSRDIYEDRNGFAAARRAFVSKRRPAATPRRLALHRVDLGSMDPIPVAELTPAPVIVENVAEVQVEVPLETSMEVPVQPDHVEVRRAYAS